MACCVSCCCNNLFESAVENHVFKSLASINLTDYHLICVTLGTTVKTLLSCKRMKKELKKDQTAMWVREEGGDKGG